MAPVASAAAAAAASPSRDATPPPRAELAPLAVDGDDAERAHVEQRPKHQHHRRLSGRFNDASFRARLNSGHISPLSAMHAAGDSPLPTTESDDSGRESFSSGASSQQPQQLQSNEAQSIGFTASLQRSNSMRLSASPTERDAVPAIGRVPCLTSRSSDPCSAAQPFPRTRHSNLERSMSAAHVPQFSPSEPRSSSSWLTHSRRTRNAAAPEYDENGDLMYSTGSGGTSSFASPSSHASDASAPQRVFWSPDSAKHRSRHSTHQLRPAIRERARTDFELPLARSPSAPTVALLAPACETAEDEDEEYGDARDMTRAAEAARAKPRPHSVQLDRRVPLLRPLPPPASGKGSSSRLRYRGAHSSGGSPSPRGALCLDRLERRESHRSDLGPGAAFFPDADAELKRSSDLAWAEYKVARQFASGTFGTVHKALNMRTGRLCVVKRMRGDVSDERKRALRSEVRVMQQLAHENIVQYLGARYDTRLEQLDIFMEYVPGGSLADMVAAYGALPEVLVRRFAKQIGRGVAYLHKCMVLHRDIKGANVLVSLDGVCKLADFGCSKLLNDMLAEERDATLQRIRGSIPWMAPEVIREVPYERPVDIWALAATVLEMASGRRPWPEEGEQFAALFKIAESVDGPPVPETVPQGVRALLRKCFRREPSERPTIAEFLEDEYFAEGD